MSERYKVFFAEETPFIEVYLRRFRYSSADPAGCQCDATSPTPLCRVPWPVRTYLDGDVEGTEHGHPLWPKACEKCGRAFTDQDEWQANMSRVYRRADTGEWPLDHRASNCTRPDDKVHRCWVRHGRPEDGTLHVDKNGDTCAAGAGSIIMHGGWHGFLHHGELYRI